MKTSLFCVVLLMVSSVSLADVNINFDSPTGTIVGPNFSLDTSLAPAQAFTFVTPGLLHDNVCSNWRVDGSYVPDTSQFVADGTRIQFALGKSYTQNDSFEFGALVRVNQYALTTGFFQMGFGLVNSSTTGFDRVGNTWPGNPFPPPNPTMGTTYDSVEFDYFPDNSKGTNYATTTTAAFGARDGAAGTLNYRMALAWVPTLPTSTYPYGLPTGEWMKVAVAYDAATRTFSTRVTDPNTNALLAPLANTPDVLFPATWSDGKPATFSVDSLAVFNYQDAWAFGIPSLIASVDYDSMWLTEAQTDPPTANTPEPTGLAVLMLGAAGFLIRRRSI